MHGFLHGIYPPIGGQKPMQCNDCVHFYTEEPMCWAECLHKDYDPDTWDIIMRDGECPGYYSKENARYDAKVRFAEKG